MCLFSVVTEMILADNDSSQDVSLDVQSQSEHESTITNSGLSPQPACCKSNICVLQFCDHRDLDGICVL
jgi:hypothetical protein